jgi:hypothetical protein
MQRGYFPTSNLSNATAICASVSFRGKSSDVPAGPSVPPWGGNAPVPGTTFGGSKEAHPAHKKRHKNTSSQLTLILFIFVGLLTIEP